LYHHNPAETSADIAELRRLLALNHEQYAEEVMAGLHNKGSSRKATKLQRRGGKKPVEGQGELF
jgi:hypothetical protein